jgi:hypothetical protein
LYAAVAVILSWVYWLKGMRPGDEKAAAGAAAAGAAEFGGERIGAADGVDLGGPSDPVDDLV